MITATAVHAGTVLASAQAEADPAYQLGQNLTSMVVFGALGWWGWKKLTKSK